MNPTIISYKILSDGNLSRLVSDVNKEILQGWQPLGAVQVSAQGSQFYQTMVKYQTN